MDSQTSHTNETSHKENILGKIIKDTIRWFFRGIASCASLSLGFLMVFFTVLLAIAVTAPSGTDSFDSNNSLSSESVFRNYGGSDKIALIELSGLILSDSDPSSPFSSGNGAITPAKVEALFAKARKNSDVKAVILTINSPGGSAVASDAIYEVIKDSKKDLPTVVLFKDVAASGGYFIGAAGDYIIANPSTITGSIGVILESYNLQGLYEKIGVKKLTFKAGKYKDILNESREMTAEEKAILDSLAKDAYDRFVSRVADGRKLPLSQVYTLAEGKIYSGKQAEEVKLVDELGTLNTAIREASKRAGLTEFKVVKIKSGNVFEELFAELRFKLNSIFAVNSNDHFSVKYLLE